MLTKRTGPALSRLTVHRCHVLRVRVEPLVHVLTERLDQVHLGGRVVLEGVHRHLKTGERWCYYQNFKGHVKQSRVTFRTSTTHFYRADMKFSCSLKNYRLKTPNKRRQCRINCFSLRVIKAN